MGGCKFKKKERKKKKTTPPTKQNKNNRGKQWGLVVPEWASLTAFLPGPSPRAATMAKY